MCGGGAAEVVVMLTQFHNGTGPLFGHILMLRSYFVTFIPPTHALSHCDGGVATAATGRHSLCVGVCESVYMCVQLFLVVCECV